VESAFYERSGQDTYVATAATAGPWSPDAQHGGPPSALAAKAIEEHEPDGRQRLARVTIDILRPVPVGKVVIRTRTVRPGRRVTLVEALMEAGGQEVLHARGWRIERSAEIVPVVPDGDPPPPLPGSSAALPTQIFTPDQEGYLASIEWRFLADGLSQRGAPGRAAWTRPRIPLLAGEDTAPMSRALLVADSGSGVGAVLPSSRYLFINVDLSVILARDPAGEWLLLESSTTVGSDGTGLAATRLSDPAGAFGRGLQTLLISPRQHPGQASSGNAG